MGTKKGPYCSDAEDNKMKMVDPVAVSVSQGTQHWHELDETFRSGLPRYPNDGLSAKIPKK